MLRLSIHAGPLTKISRFNRLDWVDIGYQSLAATADYKVVLFKIGQDAMAPVFLNGYPRWSASLWDLAARAIARSLFPPPKTLRPCKNRYRLQCTSRRNAPLRRP